MLIELKQVTYSYKKKKGNVLSDINLNIAEKGIHVFLEHNGAGKTTLFLLLSGNLKLKNGSIIFNSRHIKSRREIAFVPENGGFFESLTPSENLRFRYLLSENPEHDMDTNIIHMLGLLGLEEHKQKLCKHLSSGLKKRMSIACALICKPKILLLDEPTNGIDPATHELLIKILHRLNIKSTKILINSHDLAFVSRIADTITVLEHGKTVALINDTHEIDIEELKKLYFGSTENSEALFDEVF